MIDISNSISIGSSTSGISWSSYWETRTPSALVLTALSPTSIKLDWTNAGMADYTGHSIERSTDGVNYTEVDTVLVGTNTFTDTGLTSATLYYYRVRAYKETEYSPYSNIVSKETIYLPSDISDLQIWNDPSQLVGLSDDDGVASFTDFSGNNRHIAFGATARPLYKTNVLNGKPSVRFDGNNDLGSVLFAVNQPYTVYSAVSRLSGTDVRTLKTQDAGRLWFINDYQLRINSGASLSKPGLSSLLGRPIIITEVYNGANSILSVNGDATTGNAGTWNGTMVCLGGLNTGSEWINADVFDHFIFSGAHDSTTRRKMEEYLQWKLAIELVPTQIASVFLHNEASTIYVSPDGTGDGSTEENATELQNALTSENVIAGDTIMMLDGTYIGNFISTVTGTADAKIYIKPKNYMAAVIDGYFQIGDFSGTVGAYTRIRNIHFTKTGINRGTWETPQGTIGYPPNIYPAAYNVEVINCMYHDAGGGVQSYESGNGLLLYGNVGFNNGWADDTNGGAQNLYIHSANKTIKHNIFAGAFKRNVAVFTRNSTINNINLTENVVIERLATLFGGDATEGKIASGCIINNHIVHGTLQCGYTANPNENITVQGNRIYATGQTGLIFAYFKNIIASGNKIIAGGDNDGGYLGQLLGLTNPSTFPTINWNINDNEYHYIGSNPAKLVNSEGFASYSFNEWQALGHDADSTYSEDLPTTNETFVYPNEYPDTDDMRMGIVVIWNWAGDETVEVDLTDLGLEVGTTYRWRQAQDPLVDIDTWECAGNSYTFAMTGHTVAKPIGFDEELIPTQFPTFGCFIIEKVV